MYARGRSLFSGFALDPFLAMLAGGRGVLRRSATRCSAASSIAFITRPEHSQMLLMIAVAIILGERAAARASGPMRATCRSTTSSTRSSSGRCCIDKARVYAAGAAVVGDGAAGAFFRCTLTGKAIRACADNHLGARVVGLNVTHLYALTFGLGAACVAVAGCAMVLLVDVTPRLGPEYTLLAFVIVIVGGLGSMVGALLGGVLIGVSEALAGPPHRALGEEHVQLRASRLILLLARPQGLMGAARR